MLQANMFRDHPSEIASGLALLPKLRSLYLQNFDGSDANDCCGRHEYRNCVLQELPELCILDGERYMFCVTVERLRFSFDDCIRIDDFMLSCSCLTSLIY